MGHGRTTDGVRLGLTWLPIIVGQPVKPQRNGVEKDSRWCQAVTVSTSCRATRETIVRRVDLVGQRSRWCSAESVAIMKPNEPQSIAVGEACGVESYILTYHNYA